VRSWLLVLLALSACEGPILELPRATPGKPGGPVWVDKSGKHAPARVFVVERAADLLSGAEARGRIGDWRIDNDRVAFIVNQAGTSFGFAESGGNLVDAAPAGGEDALGQMFGCLEDFPRQPIYTAVEPGHRGDVALVRAFGHDSFDTALTVETEYALAPGANALEITTTVTNTGSSTQFAYRVGDAIEWGRAERFVPGVGLRADGRLDGAGGVLYGLGERTTYAWVAENPPAPALHGAGWTDVVAGKLDLPPGRSARVKRWLVVGDSASPSVAETAAALRKQPIAQLRGRVVQETTGVGIAGVRLFLDDSAGRPQAVARSTEDGYVAVAAPGDYRLRAEAPGRKGPQNLEVSLHPSSGSGALDVLLSRPGSLTFDVTAAGMPSPARLTLLAEAPIQLAPPFGDQLRAGNVVYTVDGTGQIDLPPGRYRVLASRGPEYTLDVKDVEVQAGKGRAARVSFQLQPAVDTKGLFCVDLHAHAQPSADSAVSLRDRVASVLGEGLTSLVGSDHNAIGDWPPVLEALGLAKTLPYVPGEEATRDGIGHFTAFPIEPHLERVRGGVVDVVGRTAHEIVAALKAPGRVIVLNHPRSGVLGYFNLVKLDPRSDALPPDWEGGFDAVEVFSGKDTTAVEAPLRDWFWLLDHGLTYTAVGGSDSHTLVGDEVGWPRTCVPRVEGQSVADALVSAIAVKHDALVTNGPFVRVQVAGRGMGQLAPAPKGRARLDIEVQAAPWVDVRRLEVFVNGERRGKAIDVPVSRDKVRFRGSIDLRVNEDAWVVVLARGDASLEPVVGKRAGGPSPVPLAITNPIFLDHNLDGKYVAPKHFEKTK
jgi:hypothetical protein